MYLGAALVVKQMKLDNLPFNWFDFFLLIWLGMGVFRGRKRGMSEELITFLQWIAIVVVCALGYRPLGIWVHSMTKLTLLVSYVLSYLVIAGVVVGLFAFINRLVGGKLVGSDVFGKAEYYLGMPAWMLRFACMLLAGLAILNARLYTQKELQDYEKFQQDVYGSEYFPGLGVLQMDVFQRSLTGPVIHKYLAFVLIAPTPPGEASKFKQKEWSPTP